MNLIAQMRDQIVSCVKISLEKCGISVGEFLIEVPRDKQFGDFSTNVAMTLAKAERQAPRAIAERIIENIDVSGTYIEKVEIAGAGFINFYLKPEWLYLVAPAIHEMRERYGFVDVGKGEKVVVEYVSANPTGPMHMGNARGGALGDGIAAVLDMAGYDVIREFYLNDSGNQIEKFSDSLEARYLQHFGEYDFPEEGYKGKDITALAEIFIENNGEKYGREKSPELRKALVEFGLEHNVEQMKNILGKYGVRHDVWFRESSLYTSGEVACTIEDLGKAGATYEKDGAIWMKCEEKDEVLVRANGVPTYFAADIAYHRNKLETREFSRAINVWGADHHGHVARMKGAMEILGINPDRLEVVIMQLVRLMRGGEVARMSKRTGEAVTLEELLDEIGHSAARYFFNMRLAGSHFDFDLELAVQKSNDNPVFYVQYAHARICSIIEQIGVDVEVADMALLVKDEERDLLRKLAEYPEEIRLAAEALEPSRMTRYAAELAGYFHSFYSACRVKDSEKNLLKARLSLVDVTRIVLRNVLALLGVEAPERM